MADYAAHDRDQLPPMVEAIRALFEARQPFAGPIGMAQWLDRSAAKGDRVVYHVGDLAYDCGPDNAVAGEEWQLMARRYRQTAMELAASGRVALSQIRLGPSLYLYCATRK
jgi:hypothetical protein